jgi:hypothetical protein
MNLLRYVRKLFLRKKNSAHYLIKWLCLLIGLWNTKQLIHYDKKYHKCHFWQAVYARFKRWELSNIYDKIYQSLTQMLRDSLNKESPSIGIVNTGKIPIFPLNIALIVAQIPPMVEANLPTGAKYSLFDTNTLPIPLNICHNITNVILTNNLAWKYLCTMWHQHPLLKSKFCKEF